MVSKNQNCEIRLWRMSSLYLIFYLLSFIFLFVGCVAQKRNCPPLATADEAAAVLKEYSTGLKPLKATGNCTLNYTNEKGEKFAQSFPVRIDRKSVV